MVQRQAPVQPSEYPRRYRPNEWICHLDRIGTTLAVGIVVEVARSRAEPVVDVECGLVLGEAACGKVPVPRRRAGGRSVAEGSGDGFRLFEASDTRVDAARVVGETVVDLGHIRSERRTLLGHFGSHQRGLTELFDSLHHVVRFVAGFLDESGQAPDVPALRRRCRLRACAGGGGGRTEPSRPRPVETPSCVHGSPSPLPALACSASRIPRQAFQVGTLGPPRRRR